MFRFAWIGILFCSTLALAQESPAIVAGKKIWDKAPHNAFTDLVFFKDRWFCVFREGKGHVSPDGALRVISSADGEKWDSVALVSSKNSDLRDAKITITPDGQLMLCGAEATHDKSKKTHQSLAWFSKDGRVWSEKHKIGDPDFWLWRVTWHKGKAYGIGYGCAKDQSVRLYSSSDGKKFDTLVPKLFDVGYPNETSIVFDGDTAYCLLRRDGKPNTGLLGVSLAPFTTWEWKDLKTKIGGPHMILLPDGRIVAAVRLYDKKVRTALCWVDPKAATITEFLSLPSGGDTSYAGLVFNQGLLWISYYSSHEGKTNIYYSKVKLPPVVTKTNPIQSSDHALIEQILSNNSLDRNSLINNLKDEYLKNTVKKYLLEIEKAAEDSKRFLVLKKDVEEIGGTVMFDLAGPNQLRKAVGHEAMTLFDIPVFINLNDGVNPGKGKGTINKKVNDAWISKIAGFKTIRRLDLSNCEVHLEAMKQVATLTGLETLSLTLCPVTDDDLAPLASLVELRDFSLASTPCTGEGFKNLKSLKNLRNLNMHHAKTNDAGLKAIVGIGDLERLWMAHTHFTDASLEHLSSHKHLNRIGIGSTELGSTGKMIAGLTTLPITELDLFDGQCTDEALFLAAKIKSLRSISLNSGKVSVTDAPLEDLSKLPFLEEFKISGANLTDAGLMKLAAIKKLRKISLSGVKGVTPKGIEQLKSTRPDLIIEGQ